MNSQLVEEMMNKYEVHVIEPDQSSQIVRRCSNKAEAIKAAREVGEYNSTAAEVWGALGVLVFEYTHRSAA